MRILFTGTPRIAVPSLALLAQHHEIVGVLTAPDQPAGRGRTLVPPPVKAIAVELGLPVLQPQRLGAETRAVVGALKPELLVCVAFGRIFGPRFLSLFSRGGINLHPSLLPKYRGPSPIPAAILAGDSSTGVTIQALAEEMDAGNIYLQRSIRLDPRETTATLTERMSTIGADMVLQVIDAITAGTASSHPQDHGIATFTSTIEKHDGLIDWASDAGSIERMVRAYDPWPLAHTSYRGLLLNILESEVYVAAETSAGRPGEIVGVDKGSGILVQTGNGVLSVQRLQLQNKKPLDWKSFLNGAGGFRGAHLGG